MASPERLYQKENKGNFIKKLAGYFFVGAVGIGVLIFAIHELGGAAGLGIPTTP